MIDRSLCACPVLKGGQLTQCGAEATVIAPMDTDYTWAYCRPHGAWELFYAENAIMQDVDLGFDPTENVRRAEALRFALGPE